MKSKLLLPFGLALCSLFAVVIPVYAQGNAFTYQGRLTTGTNVANGIYDLRFGLFDAVSSGTQIGPSLTNAAVAVSNGYFAVTLDFANGAFPGADRWLEIGVRTNGSGAFTALTPRQKITPAPYAITASNLSGTLPSAQLAGTYPSAVTMNNAGNSFSGMFSGNGAGLTNVNAATLGGLSSSNFWRTTGNAGTTPGTHFLGTTDNQALELKVNGLRTLRMEFNTNFFAPTGGAPNLIGGAPVNFVNNGVVGATIAGGGAANYSDFGHTNSVLADFGTVGGGFANRIAPSALAGTIAGGRANSIGTNSDYSTISGGGGNTIAASASFATIAGGEGNDIGFGSGNSAIGGGFDNIIAVNSSYATIAGGNRNDIGTNSSFSTIGGGDHNNIGNLSDYATIAGGHFNDIGILSRYSAIGGGDDNNIGNFSDYATIAGGLENDIGTNSFVSTIGGGYDNNIGTNTGYATIAGGEFNRVGNNSGFSAIGGGKDNIIAANAQYATIPGGQENAANGEYSFAAGRRAKANHDGSFVWADSTDANFPSTAANQFLVRASGGVGINVTNPADALHVQSAASVRTRTTTTGTGYAGYLSENSLGEWFAGIANATNHWYVYENAPLSGAHLVVKSGGNVGIGTLNPTNKLHVLGGATFSSGAGGANQNVVWTPGSASWSFTSDRNAKEDIAPVDPGEVLEKLAHVPVAEWNYIGYPQRHIGPMAQDFHAQFPLSGDDKSLNDADLHGVALAAIQGLNQKIEDREAVMRKELKRRDAENAELQERLERLEKIIRNQN